MILSMTGYGRGEIKTKDLEVNVEIRSLNNRFLDISVRLPKACTQQEQEVKDIVKKYIERGRISISISLKYNDPGPFRTIKFDLEVATEIWNQLTELKKNLGFKKQLQLSDLLQFQNLILAEDENSHNEEIWESTKQAIELGLEDLLKMRRKEGEQLYNDLVKRIEVLNNIIIKIEELSQSRSQIEFQKLSQRLSNLTNTENLDPGRLELEVAILADRVDITEECIRFTSHNKLFLDTLGEQAAVGRRLNFLLQEMNREANTIGAKVNDAEIAHLVVLLKEEIEKIREQVQNIE